MIIKLEKNLSQQEIEVLVKYAHLNSEVKQIETILRSVDTQVKCRFEDHELWLKASDIFYIESIDKKTFVYGEKNVYQTEFRLYQLLSELSEAGFVQVSKSCILNINMLDSIRPLLNSRMEATLINGERIDVTRKYISVIRKKLQER